MSYFVGTGNAGKLLEFRAALGADVFGFSDCYTRGADKYDEPLESHDSFLMNGLLKLRATAEYLDRHRGRFDSAENGRLGSDPIVIADDSGLCVPVLGNRPGVHSASLAGEPRCDVKNRIHLANLIGGESHLEVKVPAFFVCFLFVLGERMDSTRESSEAQLWELEEKILTQSIDIITDIFIKIRDETRKVKVFYGHCQGFVSNIEQNLILGAGHGYDSLFYPMASDGNAGQFSFASMPLESKEKYSHRGMALRKLKSWAQC